MGVATLSPSFLPSGTYAFYFINRPPRPKIWTTSVWYPNSSPSWLVWGRKFILRFMLLCPNYPQTSLNELCKADKRRYELTVLIYKHCDLGFVLQHWPNANVLLIKLDRPHKKNAFKLAMFGEIKRGL